MTTGGSPERDMTTNHTGTVYLTFCTVCVNRQSEEFRRVCEEFIRTNPIKC